MTGTQVYTTLGGLAFSAVVMAMLVGAVRDRRTARGRIRTQVIREARPANSRGGGYAGPSGSGYSAASYYSGDYGSSSGSCGSGYSGGDGGGGSFGGRGGGVC
jgi:hypothetical protein